MLPSGLTTPRDVVLYYDKVYYDLIDSGKAHAFLYPWGSLGFLIVFLYLLIDHRQWRYRRITNWIVWLATTLAHCWYIAKGRARNPASAFGVGIISCFIIQYCFAVLVADDCQTDFQRIERSEALTSEPAPGQPNGHATNGDFRRRAGFNDKAPAKGRQMRIKESNVLGPHQRRGPLFWQGFPQGPWLERMDWIVDVFTSFRGVGWSWQTSGVPPPPKWVQAQLRGELDAEVHDEPPQVGRTGIRRLNSRQAVIRESIKCLIIGYITLDALKTLGIHDPWFLGHMDSSLPSFIPALIRDSAVLTRCYRLLICLGAMYTALWSIFKAGPLFWCGILGPRIAGVRGEPWMNPIDFFGSFTPVLDQGLAGWWGAWWHQTFRFVFEQPANVIRRLTGVEKRSIPGRLISLYTAFFLSGCLHASGSYTQLGDTRPLLGPMRFFLLQALGITVQTFLAQQLKAAGLSERLPKPIKRLGNLVIVHVWLYFTAPFLCDDFARGGIWLFEPVPISIFRGLGLGPLGEGWWCWWNGIVRWHSGKHFWETGIAL